MVNWIIFTGDVMFQWLYIYTVSYRYKHNFLILKYFKSQKDLYLFIKYLHKYFNQRKWFYRYMINKYITYLYKRNDCNIIWLSNLSIILSVSDEGYFECIWWRLFWVYLMKVILSVSDEDYFECIWWRLFWVYLMKVILSVSDEGYFECIWWRLFWVYLMKVILSVSDEDYFECIWWRLFQKCVVYTKLDIYVFL